MRTAYLLLLMGLAGCVSPGDDRPTSGGVCTSDADCGAWSCTRIQECVAPQDLMSVQIQWTIQGVAPTTTDSTPCDGVQELQVGFWVPNSGEEDIAYRPVLCELGQFFIDRLPARFERLRISAYDRFGQPLAEIDTPVQRGGNMVTVDLRIQ